MQKFLQLNATTRSDRHQIIELVKNAIGSSGGWILDFKLFSNVSICLNFELPRQGIEKLREALDEIDLQFSEESYDRFAELIRHPGGRETDINASLQITFIHDEPDLRIPVPAVPG